MDGHFRAFSFVDRIASVQPGVRIRGILRDSRGHRGISSARSSPRRSGSSPRGRPWPRSISRSARWPDSPAASNCSRQVRPGQTLELAAEIETAEMDAVAYGGTAHADGKPVVALEHCVGPMMPLEEFDDPEAVSGTFHVFVRYRRSPRRLRGRSRARAGARRGRARAAARDAACAGGSAVFRGPFSAPPRFSGHAAHAHESPARRRARRGDSLAGRGLAPALRYGCKTARLHAAGRSSRDRGEARRGRGQHARNRRGIAQWQTPRGRRACAFHAGRGVMTARRRVAITGVGMVTPARQRCAYDLGGFARGPHGRGRNHAFRRQRFHHAHRRGSEKFRRFKNHPRPQAAQVHAAFPPLRSRRGRRGVCGCRHPPWRGQRRALGAAASARACSISLSTTSKMSTSSARPMANSIPTVCARTISPLTSSRFAAARPTRGWACSRTISASAVTPRPSTPRARPAARPLAPRSRRCGAACAISCSSGGFDSMLNPDRPLRLLPARRAFHRQRHARTREPPVRRDAQRLRPRRRRGISRAGGLGQARARVAQKFTPNLPATAIR